MSSPQKEELQKGLFATMVVRLWRSGFSVKVFMCVFFNESGL
jgi:hypothetical protein